MRLVFGSESLCYDVTLVKLASSIHISMKMIFPPQELWGNSAILFDCEGLPRATVHASSSEKNVQKEEI